MMSAMKHRPNLRGESIQGFPSVASRHWSPSRLTARTLIRSKYFEACSVLAILAGLVLLAAWQVRLPWVEVGLETNLTE